jgi:ubiquinone biosynthesis protein
VRSTTRRAREVAAVLVSHGFGSLVDLLDLRHLLPAPHEPSAATRNPGPVHLRRALEDLGPTFMKLGQLLSTRPDLVAPRYESELSLLQDSAPMVPTREIVVAIETAFGRPMASLFDRFDDAPLAAASIGQVHAATLPGGSDVVVKVRRPGVVEQVMIDLELMNRLAAAAARRSSIAHRYDPAGLAREFGATLLVELDYQREGRNAELVSEGFAGHEHVHVPKVFWDLTCDHVITEERVRGIKVDDVQALDAAGFDRSEVARRFADAYLSMVFVHRFFHADPHPGNVFVERDGRIGFVDFGMVGSVGARTGRGLGAILLALVGMDPARMVDGLLGLGVACEDVDRAAFESDLARFLERYSRLPLEQLHMRLLLADLMGVVRARRLRLPSDIALLLKTVMMCEGVAAQLDPKFELVPMLLPYATRLALETHAPESG